MRLERVSQALRGIKDWVFPPEHEVVTLENKEKQFKNVLERSLANNYPEYFNDRRNFETLNFQVLRLSGQETRAIGYDNSSRTNINHFIKVNPIIRQELHEEFIIDDVGETQSVQRAEESRVLEVDFLNINEANICWGDRIVLTKTGFKYYQIGQFKAGYEQGICEEVQIEDPIQLKIVKFKILQDATDKLSKSSRNGNVYSVGIGYKKTSEAA